MQAVVTNQMTTRLAANAFDRSSGARTAQLVPALGESWQHVATNRVVLYFSTDPFSFGGGAQRRARLCKSASRPEATVPYDIRECGVCDVSRKRERDEQQE